MVLFWYFPLFTYNMPEKGTKGQNRPEKGTKSFFHFTKGKIQVFRWRNVYKSSNEEMFIKWLFLKKHLTIPPYFTRNASKHFLQVTTVHSSSSTSKFLGGFQEFW